MISTYDSRREGFDASGDLKPYTIAKHYADDYLRHANLKYTIVHPGALTNEHETQQFNMSAQFENVPKSVYYKRRCSRSACFCINWWSITSCHEFKSSMVICHYQTQRLNIWRNNKWIINKLYLVKRPQSIPQDDVFRFETIETREPHAGEVQVESIYVSVDPTWEAEWMIQKLCSTFPSEWAITRSYCWKSPQSNDERLSVGDYVTGITMEKR